MHKLHIDTTKNHILYSFISSSKGNKFYFTDRENAEIFIVALEDELASNKLNYFAGADHKFFIYFEAIENFQHPLSEPGIDGPKILDNLRKNQNFLGALTHSSQTKQRFVDSYPDLKVFFLPVGTPNQDEEYVLNKIKSLKEVPPHFLFVSSWNDISNGNYFGRGGAYADEIFFRIRQRINCHLTIRANEPTKSEQHFPESVSRYSGYISDEEMITQFTNAHIFLIPSVQAHFVCIPQASSHGMFIIGNTQFGFCDYIHDEVNGLSKENKSYEVNPAHSTYVDQLDGQYLDSTVESFLRLYQDTEKFINCCSNSFYRHIDKNSVTNYGSNLDSILSQVYV